MSSNVSEPNENEEIGFHFKQSPRFNRMPFSWKNPRGFILTMIFETIANVTSILIYVPNITYFIGSCWLFICILNDAPALSRNVASSSSNANDDIELKRELCKMVQFYSDVKELSGFIILILKNERKIENVYLGTVYMPSA